MSHPLNPNFKQGVGRLATDRYDFQEHVDGYSFRHIANSITLDPPVNIVSPKDNVYDAIVALRDALTVPVVPDATTLSKGLIQLNGDLGGTATSVSVIRLRGFPVAATPPSVNQVLTWTGASWQPQSVSSAFTFNGDVTGSASATLLSNIQGRPVSTSAPSTNDALVWSGSAWAPTKVLPTGTGFVSMTSGLLDSVATNNIRYTGGKFQTDNNLQWKNGSITGDLAWAPTTTNKTLTLPDITDTLVTRTNNESLSNKTISAANNTITDAGILAGDILVSNGTKFVRQAQGSNGTFWGVQGGTVGYYGIPGVSVAGTGFVTATTGAFDANATSTIRYANSRFQTDTSIQWLNATITGDLSWSPTGTNKILTLPDATDTLVGLATTDTLTNKTINATNNSITDVSQAAGDLLKNDGSKFVRFARGTSLQLLRVTSAGTDLEWFSASVVGESSISTNPPYTLSSTENGAAIWLFANTVTTGTYTVAAPSGASASYLRFAQNRSASATLTISTGTGATFDIPPSTGAMLAITTAGVFGK